MRALVHIAILTGVGFGVWYMSTLPAPAPPERYGDVAQRECQREASGSAQDQKDCVSRKLIVKALDMAAKSNR
jgi:hypothetical protein